MQKIPPKNPHFFKPILPGFKNGVNIPIAFLVKYLKGQSPKFAILRRGDRSWRVKINGGMLADGWEKFGAENDLYVGDIVVFRHEGDMMFDVMVFKPSHCERGHPFSHIGCSIPNPSINFCSAVQVTASMPSSSADHPHFVSTIKPYCLKRTHLYLPIEFARSNGLVGAGKREMILRDDKERSWSVILGRLGHNVGLCRGWHDFQMANGLKEGDAYKFELIESGEKPVAKFHLVEPNQPISQGTATTTSVDRPHFVSTIKPYCLKNQTLYLPIEFARSNGLVTEAKREMILIDDKERSWSVVLGSIGGHFGIIRGWRAFHMANGLKEGDAYKFELIEIGKKPVAKFHCHFSGQEN